MATNIKTLIRKLSPFPETKMDETQSNCQYLPIVPSARLWLPRLGFGDDERFAGIFRATWRRIPLGARRIMVEHWRNAPLLFVQGHWSPLIQFANNWMFFNVFIRQLKDLAICTPHGHILAFYAPVVDAMPAVHVGELIAHELAHVFLYADGELLGTDREKPRISDPIEIMADTIMEMWGFDSEALDQWLEKNWTWPPEE